MQAHHAALRFALAGLFASWASLALSANLGVSAAPDAKEASAEQSAPADPGALRICASAKQPPLSMTDGSLSRTTGLGLENKIAVALAEAIDLKPRFVWTDKPAIYLVRDFLDKRQCDIVIGVDAGDPRVATSKPYYRTGYAMVTRADRDLDISSWNDPRVTRLANVAVPFGSPAEALLKDRGLYENNMNYLYSLVNFRSSRNQYSQIDPMRMVAEVVDGHADAAVAFAPDIAHYVKTSATPLRMVLLADDARKSNGEAIPQHFSQSFGVRSNDVALLARINDALPKIASKIEAILKSDGVPLLPVAN
ncbi:methanol oxidation system protein MoxJ [Rhodoblastus sphagnicola]|uniref:Methanol oxidation system protein MoxJ n=1 Tax=Rhodoblastus sphagnicola TaxID=333368 RepID=A0A2S6NEH6_9HYPH|nr:methanol oxidation system protein MoxJ [Rhodoblastus sphagnicola]MBB4200155.1 mxaJ protein [Rhodoblastus sphagnicola]PPQ32999.1 methanol oxidation system protein MoxJ [Rhodoblastus sphagnicola]